MTLLEGRRVLLRPYTPQDFPLLYELVIDPVTGRRFRWGGSTPSPEEVSQRAWDGVLAHFVVVQRADQEPIGLCTVSGPDFQHGYAHAAVLMVEPGRRLGMGMEGFTLMIDYAFRTWPFRKIYCEALEESLEQFGEGGRLGFEVEGCRRQHHFIDGRYQDLYTLAIWRDRWEATSALAEERIAGARAAAARHRAGPAEVDSDDQLDQHGHGGGDQ